MESTVRSAARRALAALACIAVVASLPGCWGKKKEEPVAPAAVTKPAEKVKPSVGDMLKLMPDEAALAVAAPNPQKFFERGIKLAKRVSGDEAAIDANVKEEVAAFAAKMKVPQAASFADVFRAKGLDPEAPVGVYLDIAATVEGIQKKAAEPKPLSAPREEPESQSPDAKAPAGAEPPESKDAPMGETAPKEPAVEMHDMTPPGVVVALTCADAKLAEKSIREVAAESPGAAAPQESDVNGVHLVTFDPNKLSFFIQNNILVVGNSVDLLKSVATRFKTPADVRYGSKTFPASDDDQLVQLVRLDRLKSLLDGASPWAVGMPGGSAIIAAMETQDTLKAFSGKDPMVITVSLSDEKAEVLARMDAETHPDFAQLTGPAKPLRLAALLPDSTLAFMSLRFNDETKATLGKAMVNGMGAGSKDDPSAAGAMAAGSLILSMIDDEVVLGITGIAKNMPKAVALVALSNPEQTEGFLKQTGMKMGGENYSGVDIVQVPVVFTSIYYAFVDKTLAASTDIDQLKSTIDALKAGTKSNLFQSLKPALDPAVPRYGAFIVRNKVIDEVVKPMLQQFPTGAPADSTKELDRANQVVREIRVSHDLNGAVHERRLSLYFN